LLTAPGASAVPCVSNLAIFFWAIGIRNAKSVLSVGSNVCYDKLAVTVRPIIFISAVSRELRSARQLVANTLQLLGYEPDWQDIFGTEEGELRGMIRRRIDASAGVKTPARFLHDHRDVVRLLKAGQSIRNTAKLADKGVSTVQRVQGCLRHDRGPLKITHI
jgi:hypothetical protein